MIITSAKRSGVVLWSKTREGTTISCFGIDSRSGDLSDWGGSVEKGETIYEAACRELKEESLGLININADVVAMSTCIKSTQDKAVIFFVEVPLVQLLMFPTVFKQRLHTLSYGKSTTFNNHRPRYVRQEEMKGMKLLFDKDIRHCLNNNKFYGVVERAIKEAVLIFD